MIERVRDVYGKPEMSTGVAIFAARRASALGRPEYTLLTQCFPVDTLLTVQQHGVDRCEQGVFRPKGVSIGLAPADSRWPEPQKHSTAAARAWAPLARARSRSDCSSCFSSAGRQHHWARRPGAGLERGPQRVLRRRRRRRRGRPRRRQCGDRLQRGGTWAVGLHVLLTPMSLPPSLIEL